MKNYTKKVQLGSSETLRVTSLKKQKDLQNFYYWLAGLIDGDGCYVLDKGKYPFIDVSAHTVDIKNLYHIKRKFGGSVKAVKNEKCVRYNLYEKKRIIHFIHSINGKHRLPKRINQFTKCYKNFNSRIDNLFLFREPNKIPLNKTAWLCGFFEADGGFAINKNDFNQRITITQIDKRVLIDIPQYLGGTISKNNSNNRYQYQCASKEDLKKWFKYFQQFPLKGSKAIELVQFKRILQWREEKYLYRDKFRPRILKLIKKWQTRKLDIEKCLIKKSKNSKKGRRESPVHE